MEVFLGFLEVFLGILESLEVFLGILEVSQGFLEKLGGVPRILVDVNYSSLSFVKYMYCLLIKHRIENIGNLSKKNLINFHVNLLRLNAMCL